MSETVVVVVLTAALLVAVVAMLVLVRRRPPAGAVLDEEALRRLVEQAVNRPAAESSDSDSPAKAEPDLGRFALLSHEAAAAAEAADAVRRTASEAADELQSRSRRDADRVRADALAEAGVTLEDSDDAP